MKTLKEIKEDFINGKIKHQHLEELIWREVYQGKPELVDKAGLEAARIRSEDIECKSNISLEMVKNSGVDNCSLADGERILPGIEMKVGGAVIPMGIAGPLKINGQYIEGDSYIPLATNEAALVAGVQRGIKAINLAGGVSTLVHFDGMSRAPLFAAADIYEARRICQEVVNNQELFAEMASQVKDPFVRLETVTPYQLGTKVFIRLTYKTGDAMGMNGVTKACADIARFLLSKYKGLELITISSNLCTDKKAAHINVLNGRGKSVQTEVFIPEEVLKKVFKADASSRKVEKVVFHKCYLGSTLSGTISGFNVNAANTIAAIFAATGQDLAQVITSASCFVQADAVKGGLHFMLSLPSLEVATIGGGAMFGTAKEMLTLLGCGGAGSSVDENDNVLRLAEIIAAAVTALELNTACSQANSYEMADSHVRLARGEKG